MSVSTIGGGGDTTISSPEMSPKQPLPGIGLHDPLHGRQACPEFNSFHQRVGQIRPREGLFSCFRSQNGDKFLTSPPPPASLDTLSVYTIDYVVIYFPSILSCVSSQLSTRLGLREPSDPTFALFPRGIEEPHVIHVMN